MDIVSSGLGLGIPLPLQVAGLEQRISVVLGMAEIASVRGRLAKVKFCNLTLAAHFPSGCALTAQLSVSAWL